MSRWMLAILFSSGSVSGEFFNGLHSICCECIFALENVSLSQYASADVSIGLYTVQLAIGVKAQSWSWEIAAVSQSAVIFLCCLYKAPEAAISHSKMISLHYCSSVLSIKIFESITLLRICAGQYKHADCLNFSFSLPERPYIDQQIREMSELPEGRPPHSSTETFCRDIFTQTDTFILILL